LQQDIAVSKLFVAGNVEIFQQAGDQWLPGPEPRWTKIAIGTMLSTHRQNSASEPTSSFDHAGVYSRGTQLPGCGKSAQSTTND